MRSLATIIVIIRININFLGIYLVKHLKCGFSSVSLHLFHWQAHLPRIRYSGVRNANPSDEGLSQLLKEYEQLRDEVRTKDFDNQVINQKKSSYKLDNLLLKVSRLERTLSPADKRKRLILDSSFPTTPFPSPPPSPILPPSTPSPLPALLQPIPPSKQIKRRKVS